MKYRPEIDGLRAIAVIPVILFHAGFDHLSGGFLGVDVFFVISGYLITTIILAEKEEGMFSLLTFYERRARRILPALFFVMLVSLPFAWLWLLPSDFKSFSQSLVSVSFFSSNIIFWLESGYFDAAAEMKPLLHTWSLAVEEQYYILFPLFLMAVWTLRKRWIFGAIIILGLVSLLLAQWAAHYAPNFNFYMLPTRAWELMAGALVAFYLLYGRNNNELVEKNRLLSELLGGLGLGLILLSLIFYNESMSLPSLYTVVPVFGVVLVILFSTKATVIGKLLGFQPLVGVGLISYSLYLWHQPILVFSKHRSIESQNISEILLLLFTTFVLAYLSWKFIEKPFRNKKKIDRNKIFAFSVLGSLFFIIIGSLGHFKNGFDERQFWFSNLLSYEFDNRKLQQESWDILRDRSENTEYKVDSNDYDSELWFDLRSTKQRLLVVGNSHSKDIFNVLYNSKTASKRYQLARYGVQIKDLDRRAHDFYSSNNYLESEVILLATRFSLRDVISLPVIINKIQADGKSVFIVKRIFDFQYNHINFKNLADFQLSKLCSNSCDKNNSIQIKDKIDRAFFENYIEEYQESESHRINNTLEKIAMEHHVQILDRMDYVCDRKNKRCFSMNNNFEKYFYDYGHHTLEGAQYFGNRVDKIDWLENLVRF
jgi:peptidoglycan/LPS O-acetylase OafA/YrhL